MDTCNWYCLQSGIGTASSWHCPVALSLGTSSARATTVDTFVTSTQYNSLLIYAAGVTHDLALVVVPHCDCTIVRVYHSWEPLNAFSPNR